MTQFYSRIDTEFNGDVYSIPFSYINKSEINVYINDELFTNWEFLNDSQIKLLEIPSELPENPIVSIRRITDISGKIVDYTNQSMLREENINLSQDQLLNAVQEIYDNNIQFEIDTIQTIKDNQEEIIDTLEENRQEILDIQDTYEQESDAKFVAYQDELNTKFETVSEAAEKVNALEEAVNTAVEAATTASEQANIASEQASIALEQANIALEQTQDIFNAGEQIKTNLNTKLEEIITDITEETNKQIENIQDVGFYMREDKLYFINSEGEEEEFKSGGAGTAMFDTKISDHILEGDESKGWALQGTYVSGALYPDFYNRCVEEKNNGTATETTLADTALTMFVNDNGHQFYNIADKSIVDTFYNTYGIADFYGIDEENERIFLPRNKYFHQLTDDPSKVNKIVEAGLPQIISGKLIDYVGTGGSGALATGSSAKAITPNPIYGKSDTVQPPSSLKLLYYCVGNTVVNDAQIDAGGLVSQMELKANTSLDNLNDSAKTYFDGQWTPKKLELFSTTNNQTVEVSLADYLPVDNFAYEVMATGVANTSSTSGSGVIIDVGSSLIEPFVITYARTRASAAVQSAASTVTPIGVDRKMTIIVTVSSGGTGKVNLTGYRRLGKSF